ncbi:urease accessory protein UreE [Campylobacter lari]|uniref:urease accessory protein UreE n=1 Tax=Campylobacter lari TaxID=201 RepID=UPI002153156B|nr:hypothetical protein [Campylobacter lari]EGH4467779.1 hypothetical protein [Campylobacter lari]MCR6526145.1 hypothetical protein [Campylobacter lari]
MILLQNKITHYDLNKECDFLELSWFDTFKKILRTTTLKGLDVAIKMPDNKGLNHNDCLYDEDFLILVKIKPEKVLKIHIENEYNLALISYQVGNMHLNLFYKDHKLLTLEQNSIIRFLKKFNIKYEKCEEILEPKYMLDMPSFIQVDPNFKLIKE